MAGELRQPEGAAGVGHHLQQRECAPDRLHGSGAGLGFGLLVGHGVIHRFRITEV